MTAKVNGELGLGLIASARRLGHYRWIELRLFELLGGWVQEIPEPAVKLAVAAQSRKHAWHAELWHHHLPAVAGLDPDELTVPADEAVAEMFALVSSPSAVAGTIEKLTALTRVILPRKIVAYSTHLERTLWVSDGPTARSLRFALADELDDWREGETLLQSLIATPEAAFRSASCHERLEAILCRSAGVGGPWLRSSSASPAPPLTEI